MILPLHLGNLVNRHRLSQARTRIFIIFLVFIITVFTLPTFLNSDKSARRRTSSNTPSSSSSTGLQLQLDDVIEAVSATIARNVARLNTNSLKKDWGIDLRGSSLETYENSLKSTYHDFFSSPTFTSVTPALLNKVLSKTSFIPPTKGRGGGIPKYIYTTDLSTPDALPDQFHSWIKENPDWTTMFVKDHEIDDWLDKTFPEGDQGVLKEFSELPRDKGVLRADLFRYLVLFLNGGIYTDTDTACVRPIRDWAVDPFLPPSDPLLKALPQLYDLAQDDNTPYSADIADAPSLVVALEMDAPTSGYDWRGDSFVRGIQLVQWTILANQGHPILLDVLGQALNTAKAVREGTIQAPSVLDWTGPGVFTDAVFRYLLVRYGFHPIDISGITRPTRIGDVVIMPENAFRADASEGWQGEDRVVWHGFFGRWKDEGKLKDIAESVQL